MRRLLPIILLVLVCTSSAAAKHWRGILPMHSTRADVEAVLGKPPSGQSFPNGSSYSLDEGEIFIVFTDEASLKQNNCETVAPGTVLSIRVMPKDEMLVNLKFDEKLFKKFGPDPEGSQAFIDEKEGLVIIAFKDYVQEVIYFASASDRVRCPGLHENPEKLVPTTIVCGGGRKFDEYGDISLSDEKARLDNFAIQLMNEETAQGYIIVYAGRKATAAEAQTRADRARNYVISVREINPERVKAIDGGFNEELTVTLYIVPAGAGPPTLAPTVDPKDVEIIFEKKRRPRKKP